MLVSAKYNWILPLIMIANLSVQGVLTKPAANQFLFSMFENQDSLNDAIQQEVDERRTPVWDTIKKSLDLLINTTKLDHENANKNSENNLEEIRGLLSKSTNSVTNKLKLVKASTDNTIKAMKNKGICDFFGMFRRHTDII